MIINFNPLHALQLNFTTDYMKPFQLIFYFLIVATNLCCHKDSIPVVPVINVPDTTSNNFSWSQFSFGSRYNVSHLRDVVILNDTNIWAVGNIYLGDSYSSDSTYNAVHWNGKIWKLEQIPFKGPCSGGVDYPPLYSCISLTSDDIMVTDGGSVNTYDGNKASLDCGMNALLKGGINKLFSTSSSNIYGVCSRGTIIHYNGYTWMSMESGTSIDLRDIWGTPDGKTLWASGYTSDYSKSILLKFDGITWKTIWERVAIDPSPPFNGYVSGIWASNSNLFILGDAGIYSCNLSADTNTVHKQPVIPIRASFAIRGTPTGSSIAVVYDEGIIWHYNGVRWNQIHTLTLNHQLLRVAVTAHLVIAVGTDYTTRQALIYMGKH